MPKILLSDEIIDSLKSDSKQEDFYDLNFKLKGSFGIRLGLGKKKTFFVICKKDAKRVRITLGHFPTLKYRIALKLAEDTILNSLSGSDSPSLASPILSEVASLFIKQSRLNGLSPKTLGEYERILDREILPKLGGLEIQKIKLGNIQNILVNIALDRSKVPLSNRVRALLNRIINFSIEMGYRIRNPLSSTRPLIEIRSAKNFDLSELRVLYAHLCQETSTVSNAVLLSILLAKDIRIILSLRWSDLRGFTILIPEIGQIQEVPLTESMLNIIEQQRKNGKPEDSYLFTSKRGGLIKYFEKSLAKLGMDSTVSPQLSSRILHKSIFQILKKLFDNSNADPDFIHTYKAIRNSDVQVNPKSQINFLLKWETIIKGDEDNFQNTRSNKATGQLIMVPQSWWQKT